jgi:hypothetical protein
MAQHDYVIANGTGAAVRSDINNGLAAIVSNNSGATAPSTTYAYQWWADTTTGLLKLRNAANNAWITLFQLDGEWSTLAIENGSAAAPSIYFKDSGTDTGIYSPGTDQVAISTGGTGRLFVDSNGLVGLGTSSPSSNLTVSGSTTLLRIIGSGSSTDFRIDNSVSDFIVQTGSGGSGGSNGLHFYNVNTSAYRLSLTNDGKLGIGTTSPSGRLTIENDAALNELEFTGSNYTNIYSSTTQGFDIGISNASSAGPLRFLTANAERARIDSSGRLLVGTSSGSGSNYLQIQGDTGASAGTGGISLRRGVAPSGMGEGATMGIIDFGPNDGGVGARIAGIADAQQGTNDYPSRLVFSTCSDGSASPTARLTIKNDGSVIWGDVYNDGVGGTNRDLYIDNTGLMGYVSSIKASKANINSIENTDWLYQLNPVSFNRRKKDANENYTEETYDELEYGLIAEEVETVAPELCFYDDVDGNAELRGVHYTQLITPMLKALQKATARIETLEAEVAALKAS